MQERIEPTEEDKKKWGIRGTYVYVTVNEDCRPDIPEGSYWAADRVVRTANGDPDLKYYEDWKKSYPGDFLILSNKEGISQEEQRWMSLSNMTEGPFVFDGRGGGRGPSAEEFKQFFSQSNKKQITEEIISDSVPLKQQSKNILEQEVNIGTKGTGNGVSRDTIIDSATQAKKGGETVLGHALQKHAGRNPDIWGKVKGGPDQINQTAQRHLEEIIDAPGDFVKVTNDRGITFLEKKLPDGRGVRLNQDGTFKGFIDQ
ncbi:hypothetical protein [Paenibacillus kribbensis]|uniref:hypothetical protein n=1 Tax=Paenibacillus kribbensis TaxID=172713 RepID=UPI001C4BA7B8|nr:hypothetical protein [Paenibacillus kribbensis]